MAESPHLRKRKAKGLILGVALALIAVGAFPAASQAGIAGVTHSQFVSPSVQTATLPGAASWQLAVDLPYSGSNAGSGGCDGGSPDADCFAYPPHNRMVVAPDPDITIDPGPLTQCPLANIVGDDQATAQADCPASILGTGTADLRTATGATLDGNVTAFNGDQPNGKPVIYFHVDIVGSTTSPILTGVLLTTSPTVLDITVPVVPGVVYTHFDSILLPVETGPRPLVLARCSDGLWSSSIDVHFIATTPTTGPFSHTYNQPCSTPGSGGSGGGAEPTGERAAALKKCAKIKKDKKKKKRCKRRARTLPI